MTSTSGSFLAPMVFGPPQRRLFGVLHFPATATAGAHGVVLCNAFGQEAVRAHRFMRVLAERLARQGHAVLRFDYFGTGDSMGDDLDGDLAGWSSDVLAANAELRARTSVISTTWIGMRLGASVALAAADNAPSGLRRLVLWDAVLDGERYLAHLRERHVASLEEAFSLTPIPSPRKLAADPNNFRHEAIGFGISETLREQMMSLRIAGLRWPGQPPEIVAINDPDDADGRDMAAACASAPGRVATLAVRHGTDWTTDTADNSSLVPTQALLALVQQARAPA